MIAPDVANVEDALFMHGYALVPGVLDAARCAELRASYDDAALFRSRVVMERHRFGRGEYRYFAYPLPATVERLRRETYALLAPAANRWTEALGRDERFARDIDAMLAHCAEHGQSQPTPLLLRYGAGDFKCLHQDLYGEIAFPLQAAIFLSAHGSDG